MRIHSILHGTRVNGPGVRTCVWTQGCTLGCAGCWNPKTHPSNVGREIDPRDLADDIIRGAAPGTEGITLSGGEPMQQAASVYALASYLLARRPNWSIGMFTGYSMTELAIGRFHLGGELNDVSPAHLADFWQYSLKPSLDWCITGRYDRTKPIPADMNYTFHPHLRMCSSRNQTLWVFRRYRFEDFPTRPLVEVQIDESGNFQTTGFPV